MRSVVRWVAVLCLLGCEQPRYFERPAVPGAATLIFFVHDDERVERAVLVDPVGQGYYPEFLQLGAEHPERSTVTAVAYARPPDELGLRVGRLIPDPAGSQLGEPDETLGILPTSEAWTPLPARPPIVRDFRTTIHASSRCHRIDPLRIVVPFRHLQLQGLYVAGTALTSTSSLVVINNRGGVYEISTDFVVKELHADTPDRFPCLYSPTRTGTTAIGACKDLFRVHVEGDVLVSTPWRYDRWWVFSDDQGNMLLQLLSGVHELMDPSGATLGMLPKEPIGKYVVEQEEYYQGELFLLRSRGGIERLTTTGTIAELVGSSTLTSIGTVRGTMYTGDAIGAVLRREGPRSWEPLPPGPDLNPVTKILPAREGIFVVWSDGWGAEYIDSFGWCPRAPVAERTVDVTVRLGTGYLFGTISEDRMPMTWVDLGLPP